MDFFEKELNELKGDTKRHLSLEEEETTASPNTFNALSVQNNSYLGCIKMEKDRPVHDASCECKKTNSCMSLSDKIPTSAPQEIKNFIKDVDKSFAGDNAWVKDEKKNEAFVQRAQNLSNAMLDQASLQLSKQEEIS